MALFSADQLLTLFKQQVADFMASVPTRQQMNAAIQVALGSLGGSTPSLASTAGAITADGLRGALTAQPNKLYYLSEKGKAGFLMQDPADTTTADDGVLCFVSDSGIRTKRVLTDGVMYASWFDLVPNDNRPETVVSNTLILDRIARTVRNGTLLLAVAGSTYLGRNIWYVDQLYRALDTTKDFIIQGALNLYDTELEVRGTGRDTTVIQVVSRGVGIQQIGLQQRLRAKLTGFVLLGADQVGCDVARIGYRNYQTMQFIDCRPTPQQMQTQGYDYWTATKQNLVDQKPAGFGTNEQYVWRYEYSQDWGNDYKDNGLNIWGICDLKDVAVGGFAGNGYCGYGNTTTRITGRKTPFSAHVLATANGDFNLLIDDVTLLPLFGGGNATTIALDLPGYVPGGTGGGYVQGDKIRINIGNRPQAGLTDGAAVTGSVYSVSLNLFADGSHHDGVYFNFNHGSGIFTTGDECNTNYFGNAEANSNGGPGFPDSSLLGNRLPGMKFASNEQNFQLHLTGNPRPTFHPNAQGPFTNRGNPNPYSDISACYFEEDQAPSTPNSRSLISTGVPGSGFLGGAGLLAGGELRGAHFGNDTATFFLEGGVRHVTGSQEYVWTASGNGFKISTGNGQTLLEYAASGIVNKRLINRPYLRLPKNVYLPGDNRVEQITSFADLSVASAPNQVYQVGDVMELRNPMQYTWDYVRCVRAGSNKSLPSGITMHQLNAGMVLSQGVAGLQVGDAFVVNGDVPYPKNYFTIHESSANGSSGNTIWDIGYEVNIQAPENHVTNVEAPVQYARAQWRAYGTGAGTTAQRPDMTGILPGWSYLNLDDLNNPVRQTWTGTKFI